MSRNRAGVKRRLVEIASAVLDDVQCTYTWNGDDVQDASLFLGVTEGNAIPESIGFGKDLSYDEFTISCMLTMFGFVTGEDAEEAVEAQLRTLDETLRASRRLRPDGISAGDTDSYAGIRSVRIGEVDGPRHSFPQGGPDTITGWAEFTLDCVTDL